MRRFLLLFILILGGTNNVKSQSNEELLGLIRKVVLCKSINEVKREIISNFCQTETLVEKDEFYYCDLSKKIIGGLNASIIATGLQDFYYDDSLKTEVGEFTIELSGYRKRSWRSNRRWRHIESDYNDLKLQFDKEYRITDYHFRKNGEAPELETITYEVSEENNTNEFKLIKVKGGCLNQTLIYIYIEKTNFSGE